MGKTDVFEHTDRRKSIRVIFYPAVADSIDLTELSFFKSRDEDEFCLLTTDEQQLLFKNNKILFERLKAATAPRLKMFLAPMWPVCADSNITINIIGRRDTLLKVRQYERHIIIDAHWNLFIPYFSQIAALPITHPEILDIFTGAVFHYMAIAMKYPAATKSELRNIILIEYKDHPELLLASLDIFNKTNIYHIHATRTWLNRVFAANEKYLAHIDVSAMATEPSVTTEFLSEVTGFIHKIVKNYAFRYADYLWIQQYKIIFGIRSSAGMVTYQGKDILINVHPLIHHAEWKPALYLSLGYAIMLAILQSAGKSGAKESIHLALMKTWNRYLSLDDASEQQSVRAFCDFPQLTAEQQCRSLSECMVREDELKHLDDFITLMTYALKETYTEKMEVLNAQHEGKTLVYFEHLWNTVIKLEASETRNNSASTSSSTLPSLLIGVLLMM